MIKRQFVSFIMFNEIILMESIDEQILFGEVETKFTFA